MHQDYIIILKNILGTINAVNVVCLVIYRIVHKSESDRQMQAFAIFLKDTVVVSGGHYHLVNSECRQFFQLPAQYGIV